METFEIMGHAYAVTPHKPSEGMRVAMACSAIIANRTTGKTAAEIEKMDKAALLYDVMGGMDPGALVALFAHTTRDGIPVDVDVAYVGNYHEMIAAVAKVATYNGFFGPRSTTSVPSDSSGIDSKP